MPSSCRGSDAIYFQEELISVLLTLSEEFTLNTVLGQVYSVCCAFKSHICYLFLSVILEILYVCWCIIK